MKQVTKVIKASIITNILLTILKIVIGFIWNSGALIADGIHSLSDLITDFVAMIGSYLSSKPADKDHPFGHGKIEYLTSMFISIIIIILGLGIITSSFDKEKMIPSLIVIIVSLFTIISKYILSSYIIKKGKLYNSNILISSGYESRTDVYSSIVVLISSILMYFSDKIKLLSYADTTAMILVGIFIIINGYRLLKENASNILEGVETDKEEIKEVKRIIKQYNEVKKIDKLWLLKFGTYYKLICEISMDENDSLRKVHDCVENIEEDLKKENDRIKYITIHVNPVKE